MTRDAAADLVENLNKQIRYSKKGGPGLMIPQDFRYIAFWLALASAVSSALIVSSIVKGIDKSAPLVSVWGAYFLPLLIVSLVSYGLVQWTTRNQKNALGLGLAMIGAMALWCGPRPDYPPTLDQLVSNECTPRSDLLPYVTVRRKSFWASVAISAERALEAQGDGFKDCAQLLNTKERLDCTEWHRLGLTETRYCIGRAQRELNSKMNTDQ